MFESLGTKAKCENVLFPGFFSGLGKTFDEDF